MEKVVISTSSFPPSKGHMSSPILHQLATGKTLSLGRIYPIGSLMARREISGAIQFFWRFKYLGQDDREPVGYWDPESHHLRTEPTSKGYSVEAAKRKAEQFSLAHEAALDIGGFRQIRAEVLASNPALVPAGEGMSAPGSLGKLCDDYVELMESRGRSSAGEARSAFNLHVKLAFPKIAALPANKVEPTDIATMMRRLVETGKGPHSNKLRAYLRAAYETALTAATAADIPECFQVYRVTNNPVVATVKNRKFNRSAKYALGLFQLRAYYEKIKKVPGRPGLVLQLQLFTGGQRPAQLVRLKTADIFEKNFVIYDGKGRGGADLRAHVIWMTPRIREILQKLANLNSIDSRGRTVRNPARIYALSSNGGKTAISKDTIGEWAQEAVGQALPNFKLKQIRSSMETLLASEHVTEETVGRLLSHGISGVQSKHYNAYAYGKEKVACLLLLDQLLTGEDNSNDVLEELLTRMMSGIRIDKTQVEQTD